MELPVSEGSLTLRALVAGDRETIVNGRDAESRRWLGPGSAEPAPTAVIEVGGEVVGWIDVDPTPTWLDEGEANLGYAVFPSHRGNGYAARAVRLLASSLAASTTSPVPATTHADAAVNRLVLVIDAGNERSHAVARAAGAAPRPDRHLAPFTTSTVYEIELAPATGTPNAPPPPAADDLTVRAATPDDTGAPPPAADDLSHLARFPSLAVHQIGLAAATGMATNAPPPPTVDDLTFRAAVPADADAVAAYHELCFRDTYRPQVTAGEFGPPDLGGMTHQLREWFQPGSEFRTLVAVVNGTPVAHVTVWRHQLVHLFVQPDRQGVGLGRWLLEYGEAQIGAEGHRAAELHTRVENDHAIAFYERRGWRRTGQVIHTAEHGIRYDEFVMAKSMPKTMSEANSGDPR